MLLNYSTFLLATFKRASYLLFYAPFRKNQNYRFSSYLFLTKAGYNKNNCAAGMFSIKDFFVSMKNPNNEIPFKSSVAAFKALNHAPFLPSATLFYL